MRYTLTMFLTASAMLAPTAASAQTIQTYRCQDGAQFVVAFFDKDPVAHMQLDGKAIGLNKRPAVSGSRYVKGDVTLRITKGATTLKRGKRVSECSTT